ncbi:MAG: hypothetical protein SCALA702_24470 [Melioribacteraceae bacterium]|nr:MAG: hypothetical protein SCALA702_24470 [Melioribacteraceae bacterium]
MEKQYYREIENKLKKVHSRENLVASKRGIGETSIVFVVLLFLSLYIVGSSTFNTTVRTILFYTVLSGSVLYLIIRVLIPIYKAFTNSGFDLNKYALRVGEHFPELKDELANGLQLVKTEGVSDSPQLVDAAFKSVYLKSKDISFTDIITLKEERKYFLSGIYILFVFTIMTFFIPFFSTSFSQLWNHDIEYSIPPEFTINVTPGDQSITKGSDIRLTAKVEGEDVNKISFYSSSAADFGFIEKVIKADSNNIFTIDEKTVKNSFLYYFRSGKISSRTHQITVIDRPVIKGLSLEVTPPSYSGLPTETLEDNGNITSLAGSKVKWNIISSKELKRAEISFANGDALPMNVSDDEAFVEFRIMENRRYSIVLTDADSIKNVNPIEYSIKIEPDEYPFITVISPDADVKLGADNSVPFRLKIADDYGFNSLKLKYRLSASRFTEITENFSSIRIPLNGGVTEKEIDYLWDMVPLFLAENDVVTYYFELFDNDFVNGPKSTKTRTYTVRVPSLDELFATAEKIQEESTKSLEETLKEAAELNQELEQISNEMKRDEKELTWEEKEKIENAVEKFQELEKKVDEINKQMSEMQKEMQENNLLSEETMEKYQELQKLMEEITGEDLKKAFEKMQEMLQNLDRNQNQSAFEDLKQNEEMFQKSIERTINLLKRLQIEQKVDELTKRTEDLLNQQNELSEENKNSNSESENQELAQKQNEITEKLDQLREEMENLQEKMSEFDDMPKDQLEKMMEEFDKMQNQQLSEMAQQQMRQNQNQQAQQNQEQISQNMQQMQQMMNMMQQQMQQMNQMQVFKDMMRAIDNLLTVSKEQEKLKELSKSLSPSSSQFKENAREQSQLQNDLSKILDRLSELSQKTFAISPEMGKALGDAQREMSMALSSLQNRNGAMASRNQGKAMKSLNEAANLMSSAMQNMMNQQGNGNGMMSMMQQLQQMSQQQQMLNQMTQQLQKQGQLSQQQMASLQKLAREQQLIQKSLQELNKEAKESGQSKKITSDLERIVREMQEVISGMNTQKLDDELLLKQENILSKLLDAQRSINERDFEKNRESESGEEFVRETPPDILFSTEEGRDKLRDALLKASKEGYSKDYEELIRKYFEALQKAESSKRN